MQPSILHPFHPGNVVTAVAALLVAAQTVHGVLCEGQSVHAGVEGQVWGFEILQHTCNPAGWQPGPDLGYQGRSGPHGNVTQAIPRGC